MPKEPLSAELFREAVAIAANEAIRDGRDSSRLQVSRIDAIVEKVKKPALREGYSPKSATKGVDDRSESVGFLKR
jgi:hypothetical protein